MYWKLSIFLRGLDRYVLCHPCCLSVLEVLNKTLRETSEIRGIKVGSKEFKIKAFADDLVLTLQDPKRSVQEALQRIEE